jgi:hypothetical protein
MILQLYNKQTNTVEEETEVSMSLTSKPTIGQNSERPVLTTSRARLVLVLVLVFQMDIFKNNEGTHPG